MELIEEHHLFLFLIQLLVILALARGLGEVCRKFGQPALMAELAVGIALGPTILGRYLPGVSELLFPPDAVQVNMLETVAWMGVLFLLLDTGLEIDFSVAWRQGKRALVISLADIILPMLISLVPFLLLSDHFLVDPDRRFLFAVFMATIMTISAMPETARVMQDLKLLKTNMGFLVMSALAINDIIGWVVFSIVLGLFLQATPDLAGIALVFFGVVGFSALVLAVGRRLSSRGLDALQRYGVPEPGASLTFAVVVGLLFGGVTQWLGVHALFGFFLAGVVVGEARTLAQDTRRIITQMVHAVFVPIFFVNVGLKIDVLGHFHWGLVILVTVLGVAARYFGAWAGVRMTRAPQVNRDLIAIAHTPGGVMQIVVGVLALEQNLVTEQVFVAILFGAVASAVIMGPWMKLALARRRRITLADLLVPEGAEADLAATTPEEAISRLCALAAEEADGIELGEIERNVLDREAKYGTALGDGVAVPHVHLDGLRHTLLAVGRSKAGLEWDAPDGKPVHLVFLLLSPEGANDIHVQTLAQLSRAVAPAEARAALLAAETPDAFREALADVLD